MSEQPQASIDILAPQKSHIDLADRGLPTDFGLDEYTLTKLMDDVMLLEFCDIESVGDGNEYVKRGAILIPTTQVHNMWRKGRVILKGPRVNFTEIGEIVMFPANMGVQISNVEVEGYGIVKKGLFLNEQRMFGVCKENGK
jgi:cellobiose-specific phosphotransferase system component IIB